jgi:hypothetical protein
MTITAVYYYVEEQNSLRYIPQDIINKYSYDWEIAYKLHGKKIIKMEYIKNRRGDVYIYAYEYPSIECLLQNKDGRRIELDYFNRFELTWLSYKEKIFLQNDWSKYYLPMPEEIRKFKATFNIEIYPQPLLYYQLQLNFLLSFLIPDKESPRRLLSGIDKQIHQSWLAIRICEEVMKTFKIKDIGLNFVQSSVKPLLVYESYNGIRSVWYELDFNPMTAFRGLFMKKLSEEYRERLISIYQDTYSISLGRDKKNTVYDEASHTYGTIYDKLFNSPSIKKFIERAMTLTRDIRRLPMRPDIIMIPNVGSLEDLCKEFEIGAIIECKNNEIKKSDIEQVKCYQYIFQPRLTILASLKPAPVYLKNELMRNNILLFDEVYPNGNGILKLLDAIRRI